MRLSAGPRKTIAKSYLLKNDPSLVADRHVPPCPKERKFNWIQFIPVNGKDLVGLQKLLDPLLAGMLFLFINLRFSGAVGSPLLKVAALTVVLLTSFFLSDSKVYDGYRKSRLWTLLSRVTKGWLKVVTTLIIIGFFAKVSILFSRFNFIAWAALGWLVLIVTHVGSQKFLRFLRSHGANCQHIVFLGSSETAVKFYQQVLDLPYLGLNFKAWFSIENNPELSFLPAGMPPPVGDTGDLEVWLESNKADQIHFCSSGFSESDITMKRLIAVLGNTSLPVYYIPDWIHAGMRCNVEQLGSMFLIELWGHQDFHLMLILKRTFDILAALILTFLLSPLLVIIAAFVKWSSPGPVIFCQDRCGLRGERFKIYKFRTMSVMESGVHVGLQQARRNDPRITPVGRFLRHWSLDELPQLFNVLNGSMSLVGPRPHAIVHNEEYRTLITGYMQRHQLRPGITGLAQVKGFRGETAKLSSMKNRVEADLQYLKEWSLLLDFEILIKTIVRLRSVNAY